MEYRANFVVATLTSLGNLAGSLFGLFLFALAIPLKGGRGRKPSWCWASLLCCKAFPVPSSQLNSIVKHVQQGTLDFVLKAISSQFSSHTLSPWGLPDLLFGGVLIGYAGGS